MSYVDTDVLREKLSDHFPLWTAWITRVEMEDVLGVFPVDNDGHRILYNGMLLRYLTPEQQCFYLAQQLLHIRLSHFMRGKGKSRRIWRRACDAVVNLMLKEDAFQLPDDVPVYDEAAERSAEEMYQFFLEELDDGEEKEKEEEEPEKVPDAKPAPNKSKQQAGKSTEGGKREIEDPGLAAAVAGLSDLLEPSMQLDFDWFPGDTIRDGLIPYRFRPYPVSYAEVLLDTSASVDTDLLRAFVRGVKALLREDAVLRVGCFDTRFYGFREINSDRDIDTLELRGAGGTNFTVAVNSFTGDAENRIIFTDGYAEMPEQRCDAVWVVYGNNRIHPKGGRVIYAKPPEEKEKHEIDFLIT